MADVVYSYRQRHGVRFALRGADIEDVYIGRRDNVLTISQYSDDQNQWKFDIIVDYFMEDVEVAGRDISN